MEEGRGVTTILAAFCQDGDCDWHFTGTHWDEVASAAIRHSALRYHQVTLKGLGTFTTITTERT